MNAVRNSKFCCAALVAAVACFVIFAASTFAQLPAPAGAPPVAVPGEAEVERVIVTGSNIPSAEETGPNPFNLRGLLAKETLVLVDGKRVAFGSLNAVGFSGGVDINLIPFPMIDHIDILKDGASAVYGSDAITGVVNFFLVHKFRGLEIGGSYGNTNMG